MSAKTIKTEIAPIDFTFSGKTYRTISEAQLKDYGHLNESLKCKEARIPLIQQLLLSALALVHHSGNGAKFTHVAKATCSLDSSVREAIRMWILEVGGFTVDKKTLSVKKTGIVKGWETAVNSPWTECLERVLARKEKEAADRRAAKGKVPAPTETAPDETAPTETAPTETAPTETAPDETAPTETAPDETAPTETPVDERTPQELDDAELAIDLVRTLSDTQFADFAAFFAQEKERRELTMIAAIRKAA